MMPIDTLDTEDKAEQFRKKRLKKIEDGDVLGILDEVPHCVLHWLPISRGVFFNPDILSFTEFAKFMLMEGVPVKTTNSDGFKLGLRVPTNRGERRYSWSVQLFRSGALEMAFVLPLCKNDHGKTKQIIPKDFTEYLWGTIDEFKKYTLSFDIDIPVRVGISLFNVLGCSFYISLPSQFYSVHPDIYPRSGKEEIILREEPIKSLENMKEDERLIFDKLWRSFDANIKKCPYYDDDGNRENLG